MHYLHPRSRTTGTLFTTTLVISFLVVALPHLLPCPVDRRQFADSYETPDGRRIRRKRKAPQNLDEDGGKLEGSEGFDAKGAVSTAERPLARECPIPKPSGILGRVMGFKDDERPAAAEVVVLKSVDGRRVKQGKQDTGNGP